MKLYKKILMSVLIPLLAASCSEDGLSTQNAGKEKPVVTIEPSNSNNYLMTFTLSVVSMQPSSDMLLWWVAAR